jgi:thiol-disulfide isomerase/thioredoxin
MKNVIVIFCLGLLTVSCSQKKESYKIDGAIPSGYNGKWAYISDYISNETIDSVRVADDKFSFIGLPDTINLVKVWVEDSRMYANAILEAGVIRVDLSKPGIVTGTPLNEKWLKYVEELTKSYNETNSIEELGIKYLLENNNNAIGMSLFNNLFYNLNAEKINSLYPLLGEDLKKNPGIQKIMTANERKINTVVGKMFTDFTIEHGNFDNSPASFSDYVGKGKYVLVDFWASWCGPCIAETPVIAEVYKKYKGSKFEVLSIAVWDKREATLEAITKHNLVWSQIIDAQQIPTDLYGINGIPHIILFGPDGTILARDLRGDNLKAKVEEVIQFYEDYEYYNHLTHRKSY